MTQKAKILQFLQEHISIAEDEALPFVDAFEEKLLRKKQLIVQPGFIARHRYLVADGALRSFIVTNDGREVTIGLAIEDWLITDYNSYIFQQPATLFVEAISKSTVFTLNYEREQYLKTINPKFETLFRVVAEQGLANYQRRIITNLTHSAENRYDLFVQEFPEFVNSFPQYILASYLGMTTEFLSKIRNNKLRK